MSMKKALHFTAFVAAMAVALSGHEDWFGPVVSHYAEVLGGTLGIALAWIANNPFKAE